MSTILKALKQSEARRPGEGSLPGRLPEAVRAENRKRVWAGVAAGLMLASAAVVVWWWSAATDTGAPPAVERRISEVSLPERAAAPKGQAAPREQPTGERRNADSETTNVGDEADRPEPSQPAGEDEGEAVAAREPASTKDVPAAKAPETASRESDEKKEPELEPFALLPRLEHLAAARREALPALSLNAHVYAPPPAESFVLINLNRYREGDRVAPGVVVRTIYPGGVVLEDRQGRFVLQRP